MEAKIKLKIKDVELELTEEEAKELKDILERLTGMRIEIKERIIERDRYPWYYPIWVDTPKYERWEITCGTTGMGAPPFNEPISVCYKSYLEDKQ